MAVTMQGIQSPPGTSPPGKGGDVILEQAQQEEKTNPYNMPVGTEAPQSEAPAATTPAEAPAPAARCV